MPVVTMRAQISGTRNNEAWPAVGETIDLPEDEAAQLISQGMAVAGPEPTPETPVEPGDPQDGEPGNPENPENPEDAVTETPEHEDSTPVESPEDTAAAAAPVEKATVTTKPSRRR